MTGPTDVPLIDGSIYSDQQTILDIRDAEYPVTPMAGDQVTIPFDCNGAAVGTFEILDTDEDGGGLTTLSLRKVV